MLSIFNQIKGIKYKQSLPVKTKPVQQDIILQWLKNKDDKQLTTQVLLYIKPTVLSALHTYTPGQLASFRVKALSMAMQSLKDYNKSKGASPKTYVFTNLQRLNRIRRLRLNIIHVPLSQVYLKSLIDKKRNQMLDNLGRLPSTLLLADATGISLKKLNSLYSNTTFSLTASLDALSGESSFKTKDVTDRDYYNYIYHSASPVDKKIMLWTSGYTSPALSNNDIAKKLNISPGAVSQRKAKLQAQLSLIRGLL